MSILSVPAAPSHPSTLAGALQRSLALEESIRHLPEPQRSQARQAARDAEEDLYAAQRCDEQELLDRYPGLLDKPDAELIDLIANPPALFGDCDEVVSVAAVVLERRLSGVSASVAAA